MAAYSDTPTVSAVWEEGDRFGKRRRIVKRMSLTLSSQGGETNNIPASALGFTTIEKAVCISFTDGSSQIRAVDCITDGDYLYVCSPTQSTDADRGEPSDVTGTLVVEVSGL